MYLSKWALYCLLLLLLHWSTVKEATGARILVLFPHIGRSHFLAFEPYFRHLSTIGHEVVVYSHFPTKEPLPNYTDVSLAGTLFEFTDTSAMPPIIGYLPSYFMTFVFWQMGVYQCLRVLTSEPAQNLIRSEEKFDLVITELFNSDCFLPFVHKFQAPNIALSSSGIVPVAVDRFGNPDSPAYFANMFLPLTDKMDFLGRVSNTILYVFTKLVVYLCYDIPNEVVARLNFGLSIPWLRDIAYNTSLLLLNTHPITHGPRPYVPNIVEVAGIHLTKGKKLPDDVQKFLDEADNGVIYVSFGSLLKTEAMSSRKIESLVHTFSQLNQSVLWKWKGELENAPPNLMTRPWIPQFEVLNHPNVKVFVTHSGLLGTIEALHNAVPLVIMPFFGDQYNNAKNLVQLGVGVEIMYSDLTAENLFEAINKVVNNASYKQRAVTASKIFRDRPSDAMETAVYWTEYVLRHNGATHLQSAARDLNIFQYLLLDVVALLLVMLVSILGIVYLFIKTFCLKQPKEKTL